MKIVHGRPSATASAQHASNSRWFAVLLLVGAGVVSAFQVGKAPMALAAIQADLAISLATAAWLISAFALIGAVAGAPAGLAVDHIGARRMVVGGLLLQAAGSALGALATSAPALLTTRALEGVGFLAVIVAAPALIVAVAPTQARDRAVAVWATFMPVGMTLVMLAAPLLASLEWRGFWLLNAGILFSYAVLAGRGTRGLGPAATERRSIRTDMKQALISPGPWLLGGIFAAFSAAFFAIFGFLPSILSDRLGVSLETASILTAVAVAISGVGNLVCGQLLARGYRPLRLLVTSFGVLAFASVGILSETLPGAVSYGLCVVFAFASGLIPVVVFNAAPRYAPRPELLGVTLGFAMQGNNIGLMVGPAVAGGIAGAASWSMVPLFVFSLAAAAILIVVWLGRIDQKAASRPSDDKLPSDDPGLNL